MPQQQMLCRVSNKHLQDSGMSSLLHSYWMNCSVIKIVKGASQLLLAVLGRLSLVDTWPVVGGISSEGDVQGLQEGIHACQQALRLPGCSSSTGLTIVHNDSVCKVCGHDEIVLYNECCLLAVHDEALDDLQCTTKNNLRPTVYEGTFTKL